MCDSFSIRPLCWSSPEDAGCHAFVCPLGAGVKPALSGSHWDCLKGAGQLFLPEPQQPDVLR